MDAGVVSGTLHATPDEGFSQSWPGVALEAPAKCRPPFGLRRRGAISFVIAPRRCEGIAVVALPRI